MLAASAPLSRDAARYLQVGSARMAELDRLIAARPEISIQALADMCCRPYRPGEELLFAGGVHEPRGREHRTRLQRVSDAFGVAADQIRSSSREHRIALARHVAAYLIRRDGNSLRDTGCAIRRDHATALHSVQVLAEMRKKRRAIDALLKELEGRP